MEKHELISPDLEKAADFTGFSEDQINKAIESGVGENKTIAAKSVSPVNLIAHVKNAGTIFFKRKKRQF